MEGWKLYVTSMSIRTLHNPNVLAGDGVEMGTVPMVPIYTLNISGTYEKFSQYLLASDNWDALLNGFTIAHVGRLLPIKQYNISFNGIGPTATQINMTIDMIPESYVYQTERSDLQNNGLIGLEALQTALSPLGGLVEGVYLYHWYSVDISYVGYTQVKLFYNLYGYKILIKGTAPLENFHSFITSAHQNIIMVNSEEEYDGETQTITYAYYITKIQANTLNTDTVKYELEVVPAEILGMGSITADWDTDIILPNESYRFTEFDESMYCSVDTPSGPPDEDWEV